VTRVKVLPGSAAPVEIDARRVDELAEGAGVRDGHVKTTRTRASAHAGKWIGQIGAGGVIVEADGQAVARAAPAPATAAGRGGTQSPVQPDIQIVAVADGGSREVEVLLAPGEVRQGNEFQ
jgi:hypothetical protein